MFHSESNTANLYCRLFNWPTYVKFILFIYSLTNSFVFVRIAPRGRRYRYYCLTFQMILFTRFETRREAREREYAGESEEGVLRHVPVWDEQGTGRRWRPPSCLSLGNPSTTAYHRYPLLLSRSLEHSMDPPLSSRHAVCRILRALFLSFFSPLSPNIIDLYYRHTALRRSFQATHQHRISLRVEGRSFFLFALNTREHFVEGMEDSRAFFLHRFSSVKILESSLFPCIQRRSMRTQVRLA